MPANKTQNMEIPSEDYGGSGFPLHFLHANGYPPACYTPLLDLLKSHYHVFGMLLRPLWPDSRREDLQDWIPLSNDLLAFLGNKQQQVIGVGHSIGGIVTLRAALYESDKFLALILIEPVLFPPYFIRAWNLVRFLGLGYQVHPLIQNTLKRRREFDDLNIVFQGYRNRRIFRYLSDAALRIYIQGITKPNPEHGYSLAYTPEWEAHIYFSGVWRDMELWHNLNKLKVPTLIIRGAETDTFWEGSARRMVQTNSAIRVITLDRSTHLVPLEQPKQVFEKLRTFLSEVI